IRPASRRSIRGSRRVPVLEALELRRLLSTIIVNTLNDAVAADGKTSLREAIAMAKAGDTVTFANTLSGTLGLNAELTLARNVTIQGRAAATLGISGGGYT